MSELISLTTDEAVKLQGLADLIGMTKCFRARIGDLVTQVLSKKDIFLLLKELQESASIMVDGLRLYEYSGEIPSDPQEVCVFLLDPNISLNIKRISELCNNIGGCFQSDSSETELWKINMLLSGLEKLGLTLEDFPKDMRMNDLSSIIKILIAYIITNEVVKKPQLIEIIKANPPKKKLELL